MKVISDTSVDETSARVLYVLAAGIFPLLVAGLLTLLVFASGAVQRDDGISHQTMFAYFNYPVPGDLVASEFEVTGRVNTIPAGRVVYLAERVGDRFWPKMRIGTQATNFRRTQQTKSGQGYQYTIELLAANADAETHINRWFEQGSKSGKYPGIDITDGISVLAKVRVVRQ